MSLEVTQRVEATGLPDFRFEVQTLLNSAPPLWDAQETPGTFWRFAKPGSCERVNRSRRAVAVGVVLSPCALWAHDAPLRSWPEAHPAPCLARAAPLPPPSSRTDSFCLSTIVQERFD